MNDVLKLTLCQMQGSLFVLAQKAGWASDTFIKTFMQSKAAQDLDRPFHHMQWCGEHYLLERLEEEETDKLKMGETWDTETLYWIGYLYRFWHFYTRESSKDILRQAPTKTMRTVYLMYHTMSPEVAVEKLKETYLDSLKKKKSLTKFEQACLQKAREAR